MVKFAVLGHEMGIIIIGCAESFSRYISEAKFKQRPPFQSL